MFRTADKRLALGKDLGCIISKHHPITHAVAVAGGVGVAASATPNAKGTYVEITSSTSIDADGFFLTLLRGSAIADWLVDIATGAASSEVDKVSNILLSAGVAQYAKADEFYIPLPIAAGTRLAVRCQSSDASAALTAYVTLARGGPYRALRKRRATTYGANTADSGGTQLDPGGSAGTKGAYAELSAAITNPIESMLICIGNINNATRTDADHRLDLAMGAAASEVNFITDLPFRQSTGWDILTPCFTTRNVAVPSGVRLSARTVCTITDATDRLSDLVVIGFD